MKNRQIKKIIKKYGRWYHLDDDFIKNPDTMELTYFSCGGLENKIPWRKLKRFYPYCIDRYVYWINNI
jgi:hypothetical protein